MEPGGNFIMFGSLSFPAPFDGASIIMFGSLSFLVPSPTSINEVEEMVLHGVDQVVPFIFWRPPIGDALEEQFVPYTVGTPPIDDGAPVVILNFFEITNEFQRQFGSNSSPGQCTFQEDAWIHRAIFQETLFLEGIPLPNSLYVLRPLTTETILYEGRDRCVSVFPYFRETLNSFLNREGGRHIYAAVQMKDESTNGPSYGQLFTFSEEFKCRLIEFFTGISDMHAINLTHGNINGDTMVLVEDMGRLKGNIIGSSLGTSGDPNVD